MVNPDFHESKDKESGLHSATINAESHAILLSFGIIEIGYVYPKDTIALNLVAQSMSIECKPLRQGGFHKVSGCLQSPECKNAGPVVSQFDGAVGCCFVGFLSQIQ